MLTSGKYILVDDVPVEQTDLLAWGKWIEETNLQVDLTVLDDCYVSTVFLGCTILHDDGNEPLLFETRVMGGRHDGETQRYATMQEAKAGHIVMVRRINPYFFE